MIPLHADTRAIDSDTRQHQAHWDTPPDTSARNQVAWHELPVNDIPLNQVVYPCHDIDPDHIHGAEGLTLSSGPIHVEQLIDGHYFVHDGRHRAIRAQHRGDTTIPAHIHP